MSDNPLLAVHESGESLPDFEAIKPEHIVPAVKQRLAEARGTIDDVLAAGDFSWNGLVEPLTDADEAIEKVWAPVSHLNAVVSTAELREAHDACLPLLSDYSTFVGQHRGLFDAYQSLRHSDEFETLSEAQQKLITDTLRDFHLSGVDLDDADKQRYAQITSRLPELSSQFSNHLLDGEKAYAFSRMVRRRGSRRTVGIARA